MPVGRVQKLFKYIGGNNEEKEKIAMTCPVRVLVHPSEGPFCESNFTISFFVPLAFQVRPGTPLQRVDVITQHRYTLHRRLI